MGPAKHSPQPLLRRTLRGALLGLVGLFAMLAPGEGAFAQGAVRSVHGDWQIRCDTPPGAKGEQCALIQSVVAEDKANANLVVIVLKTSDGKSRLMRIIAPLGVLLPSAASIERSERVDQVRSALTALPNDYRVVLVLREIDIHMLKNGLNALTARFLSWPIM